MKCIECDAQVTIKQTPYYYRDVHFLGYFEAEICSVCNTVFFTEKGFDDIEKVAKQTRFWGEISNVMPEPIISGSSVLDKPEFFHSRPMTINYSIVGVMGSG